MQFPVSKCNDDILQHVGNLDKAKVLEPDVGPQAAPDDHAEKHHDLFPSCFLLVLQSFLGVSRGSRRVLNRTLHVSVDSDGKLF